METTFLQAEKSAARKFIANVYGWMFLALLVSGAMAIFTISNVSLLRFLFMTKYGFYIAVFADLGIAIWLTSQIRKISPVVAGIGLIAYAAINGLTLSSIFFIYDLSSIGTVFFICAAMFGGMSLYGKFTKSNLATAGHYLIMTLWGVIIASLVNIFLHSDLISWIISIAGVVIFAGLTAFDTQRVMKAAAYADGSDAYKNISIIAALNLYLDFINMFLYLLRLFGKRR